MRKTEWAGLPILTYTQSSTPGHVLLRLLLRDVLTPYRSLRTGQDEHGIDPTSAEHL